MQVIVAGVDHEWNMVVDERLTKHRHVIIAKTIVEQGSADFGSFNGGACFRECPRGNNARTCRLEDLGYIKRDQGIVLDNQDRVAIQRVCAFYDMNPSLVKWLYPRTANWSSVNNVWLRTILSQALPLLYVSGQQECTEEDLPIGVRAMSGS